MIITTLTCTLVALQAKAEIDSFQQTNLKDIAFDAEIVRQVRSELTKISDDYARSYVFDKIQILAKEPFKLRLEASSDDTKVVYVINGAKQSYSIPKLRLNQRTDLSKSPGRRQTFLDFGVPTSSLFADLFVAKFVRYDRESKFPVFDLTYPAALDDTTRFRVWIDPDKRITTKREWYGQQGQLRATLYFNEPVSVSGVWFPTSLLVKNSENKFAAQTKYSHIRINSGIPDSNFMFK